MKVILEFNLDDFDDVLAHKRAISATDAYLVILSLDEYLRYRLKYEEMSEEAVKTLDEVRTKLYESIEKYNVDMENLR